MTARWTSHSADRPQPSAASVRGDTMRRIYFASPLYRLRLAGRGPRELTLVPPDPWPGDANRGADFIRNSAVFADGPEKARANTVTLDHGFTWLRDLRATGSDDARRRTRQLVRAWIQAFGKRPDKSWRPDTLGERITSWLCQYDFFCASADDEFQALFFRSLSRQARHMMRVAEAGPADARRLVAHRGCLYAALCLPGFERHLVPATGRLLAEIERQILADGGQFERNPMQQLAVLRDLIDIRAALIAAQREVPAALQSAVDRMAPVLRAFRHGDGGLALFNGSGESAAWLVDLVLDQADARGKPPASLPYMGFQRLAAGRATVIVDTGAPPPPGADALAHAGTLAFEMSVGRDRLVVNCGSHLGEDEHWRRACRTTAAHSTAIVDDTNSSEILTNGFGRRPREVSCNREEDSSAILVTTSHDGYESRFHLTHRRRLLLTANGEDLRGEDNLSGEGSQHFDIRFHLHPDIRVSKDSGSRSAALLLPSGESWRFRASGGSLAIEESVYLGAGNGPRRNLQVVISGTLAGVDATIKWGFRREA